MTPDINTIREFWEDNPLCAGEIGLAPEDENFFESFDNLRLQIEDKNFADKFYEYKKSANKKVLDIGCGNGYVLSHYRKNGSQIFGVDLTRRALEVSRRRFRAKKEPGYFSRQNAEKLAFKNNSFDIVVSVGVLHHVPDTQRAINEIYRILKPGGKVFLMFYHKNSFYYHLGIPLRVLFAKKHRGKTRKHMINRYDGQGNPLGKVYSKNDVRKMMETFQIEGFDVRYLSDPVLMRTLPNSLCNWLGEKMGWLLYVKGIKKT